MPRVSRLSNEVFEDPRRSSLILNPQTQGSKMWFPINSPSSSTVARGPRGAKSSARCDTELCPSVTNKQAYFEVKWTIFEHKKYLECFIL